MKIATVAGTLGKGLLAGLAGTGAMTVSNSIETRLLDRPPRMAPTHAAEKMLGMGSEDGRPGSRFGNPVYWGYGTVWGLARALIRAVGLSPKASTVAHFATLWSSEQMLLPALDVAPPSMILGRSEIAIDAWNHAVYAATAGLAYELLDRRR